MVLRYANKFKFSFSRYLTSWPQMTFDLDLWHFDHMNISRFPYYIDKNKFGSNRTSTSQMRPFSHIQPILQLDLRWPLTLVNDLQLHEGMKVPILYQQTKFGSNWTSTFQMRPFSHFQPILQLDLGWPLTLICDLWPHQQMRDPMLHLWLNFGWNPLKHVEGRVKILC